MIAIYRFIMNIVLSVQGKARLLDVSLLALLSSRSTDSTESAPICNELCASLQCWLHADLKPSIIVLVIWGTSRTRRQPCTALFASASQDPEGFQGGVWNSFADVMAIYHKKHSVR